MADIRNIRRNGDNTPDKICRCIGGNLHKIKKIYKGINGQAVVVWDIGSKPTINNILITKWNVSAGTFTFPALTSDSIPYKISWGDSSNDDAGYSNAESTHTYAETGEYTVTVSSEISMENGFLKGITYIGTALKNKSSLLYVDMENSWVSLSSSMFYNCTALETVKFPSLGSLMQVTSIPDDLFYGCTSLKNLFNHEKAKVIGAGVFSHCTSLSDIEFPALETIGGNAFSKCTSLKSFSMPETVSSIGSGAFSDSGLTSIEFPQKLKTVIYVCNGCKSLETVKGLGLESILAGSFTVCTSLKIVELSNNLKLIKSGAFSFAAGAKIYFHGTKAEWDAVEKESGWCAGSYTMVYV